MIRKLTILLLTLVGLANAPATACSCVGESTVKGGYTSADIVAAGRVISVETVSVPDTAAIQRMIELGVDADSLDVSRYSFYFRKVLLLVDSLYKGQPASDTLTIYTGSGGGDCGFRFAAGKKYIVYGDSSSYFGSFFTDQAFPNGRNVYWTNRCTRTQEYNRNEIEALEAIKR